MLIKFIATGAGEIVAVDNGNIASHEMYKASERHAFKGQCVAILKANQTNGKITIRASADGLEVGTINVDVINLNK